MKTHRFFFVMVVLMVVFLVFFFAVVKPRFFASAIHGMEVKHVEAVAMSMPHHMDVHMVEEEMNSMDHPVVMVEDGTMLHKGVVIHPGMDLSSMHLNLL